MLYVYYLFIHIYSRSPGSPDDNTSSEPVQPVRDAPICSVHVYTFMNILYCVLRLLAKYHNIIAHQSHILQCKMF